MLSSIYYGEIQSDKLVSWNENKDPYNILVENNRVYKLGGWEFLDIANKLFDNGKQVDWGSYAYQCTKEQLEKLMEQTGCEIDKMNELASEKIYGDPRNPNILKMFGFVNVGERAGSGVDKIMISWAEQNWKKPEFDFSERSDRVTLKLEVGQVVYIPGAVDLQTNRQADSTEADDIHNLNKEQRVVHYLKEHDSISTQQTMELCEYKTRAGARKLLDKMIQNDILRKTGSGPGTKYIFNDDK